MTEDETPEDRFGLPKMSTTQEVAVSFALFVLGTLLVASVLYPISRAVDIGPAIVGLIMISTSYLFAIESIREFEEKDHFLARKLMKS